MPEVAHASEALAFSHSKLSCPPNPRPTSKGPRESSAGLGRMQNPPPRPTVIDPKGTLLAKASHPSGVSLLLPNTIDYITSLGCMYLFLINL